MFLDDDLAGKSIGGLLGGQGKVLYGGVYKFRYITAKIILCNSSFDYSFDWLLNVVYNNGVSASLYDGRYCRKNVRK